MVDEDEERERAQRVADRIASLRSQAEGLERTRTHVPRLFVTILLAIPAGFFFGVWAAFATAFCAVGLVGVAAYIFGARRAWYLAEANDLEGQLRAPKRARMR